MKGFAKSFFDSASLKSLGVNEEAGGAFLYLQSFPGILFHASCLFTLPPGGKLLKNVVRKRLARQGGVS